MGRWEVGGKTWFISFADLCGVNTPSMTLVQGIHVMALKMELGRTCKLGSLLWHTSALQPISLARHHPWASVSDIKPSSLPVLGFHNFNLRQAGPWAPLLQCLHLHKCLLKQQNTKKLQVTEYNCAHVQLGQIMNNKIQKDQKPNCHFWGARSQKQGTAHAPCTQHHQGGGQTT